ncbi:hypothetical protein D3C71_77850 [compost metagenome]
MNQLDFTSIPTHFGETRGAAARPLELKSTAPIECRSHYINNLTVPVTIVWRSGFSFSLPPVPNLDTNRLIIRTTLNIDQTVKNDVARVLSAVDDNSTQEMIAMRNAFIQQNQGNTYRGASIVLDYPMSFDELRRYGGSVYHNELDCVISLLPLAEAPLHPHSEAGRRSQTVVSSPVTHGGPSFAYAVEMVDNFGRHGPRYLNMNGQIYKITPKKDSTRRDGFYIVSNMPTEGDRATDEVVVTHYPFELGESDLSLYESYSEALNLGDTSLTRKEELASLEHSNRVMAADMQRMRSDHEREMLEKQARMKELEMERDRRAADYAEQEQNMAQERAEMKDKYEKRSYERKDNSEALKVLPSIIVGLGAIFMAIRAAMG